MTEKQIQASEMRIGNKLLLDGEKQMTLDWVKYEKVSLIPESGYPSCIVDIERLSGIPFSPEWLERMGFVKGHSNYGHKAVWDLNRFTVFQRPDGGLFVAGGTVDLEFVHQLQNLYFALTGQELEIKEKV